MSPVILLVEDNPTDEKLTVRAFKRCAVPHEIIVARDGAEALDFVFATGQHAGRDPWIDLRVVLLDLMLPRISGLEVLRRLRADPRTTTLPVVVLTASKEEEDVIESYRFGANGYVRKPVDFVEFAEAAATIGIFWLSLNQPVPAPRGSR
jgi:two-component system response regulator